jgi:hypothetical protein
MVMIEVIANDRLGKKVRVKVDSDDTVEVLKVMNDLWSSLVGGDGPGGGDMVCCRY